MEFTEQELQAMKRADLQKLCKKFGVKANMKTEKLVEELLKYSDTTQGNEENLNSVESNEPVKEPEIRTTGEVNTKPPAKQKSGNKTKKTAKASKIPRLNSKSDNIKKMKSATTNGTMKNKTPRKTPNWSKIHQKQFDKMDSLDVYLSKKRKRIDELENSAKRVKVLTEERGPKINKVIKKLETRLKTKPVVTPKLTESKQKRLTFNFLASAKENSVHTPAAAVQKRPHETTQKPATPFSFTSNTMPFGSPTPRKKFDLQASLAKPLKYKPYKGKLPTPPYAKQSPKTRAKKGAVKSHERDVKAVKTTTRTNERRERQMKSQSQARESALSRRRGLTG